LSPPLPPPHTASPAVTPLPGPLQQQQLLSTTPQSLPPQRAQNQQQQVPESTPAQQQGQQQNQQQEQQQQQQQQRGRSRQQLQELQDLAGILQPVLYDDAAASEVLSEWLSGSDVAVADSEAGSDAALGPSSAPGSGPGFLGPGSGPFLQPPYMLAASLQQPSSAASTAGATMPPVVPTVLHFTPIAAGGAPGSWPGWVQGSSLYNSGERAGLQWAGASPEPAATASSAGPNTTPTAAARLQQQWSSQQRTPANTTAAAGGGGGASGGGPSASQGPYRGAGSNSAAGRHSAASSSAVRGGGIPPAAAAGQQVGLSPGSSVAVRQAAAEEGDDGQSLVLDIDLAKVINSGSAAGTIVLQVRSLCEVAPDGACCTFLYLHDSLHAAKLQRLFSTHQNLYSACTIHMSMVGSMQGVQADPNRKTAPLTLVLLAAGAQGRVRRTDSCRCARAHTQRRIWHAARPRARHMRPSLCLITCASRRQGACSAAGPSFWQHQSGRQQQHWYRMPPRQ
jgi:hypothetical protein